MGQKIELDLEQWTVVVQHIATASQRLGSIEESTKTLWEKFNEHSKHCPVKEALEDHKTTPNPEVKSLKTQLGLQWGILSFIALAFIGFSFFIFQQIVKPTTAKASTLQEVRIYGGTNDSFPY